MMNGSSNTNVPQFVQYTEEQRAHIRYNLEKSLGPEYVSFRAAAGGSQVIYIEGWKALNLANQIFGFNGWSSEVRSTQVDYVDNIGGKWSLGLSAVVRVTLKDGTFHEDIGYGNIENCKSRAMAFEKAKKEAVTDGVKRALRQFGNVLGNCLYEKNYLKRVKEVTKVERITTEDQLLRPEENIRPQFDQNGKLVKDKIEPKPQSLPAQNQNQNQKSMTSNAQEGPQGKIIPEDSYIEDSFLFSDEVFEEDENGIADHEMEALLDKNNKSPPQNVRTPEPNRLVQRHQQGTSQNGVAFVSTRLARDLIENAPALSPLPATESVAFNAHVRTPLHDKNSLDHTKSAPIKRTPLTARKVIYGSSKKPLSEDADKTSQHGSQGNTAPQRETTSPTTIEPSSRPLQQIQSNNILYDDPKLAQKRTIGAPPGRNGANKRIHRSETS